MPDTPRPRDNRILASLAPQSLDRIKGDLELIRVTFGESLQESGHLLEAVYFPVGAVFALSRFAEDGDMAEIALAGSEGVLGVAAFLGDGISSSDVIAKRSGHAYSLDTATFRRMVAEDAHFKASLLQYTQALVAQLAQTSICNRLHNIDQRLARCLLQLRDRQDSDELEITQEFLSHILGIRRVGVTRAVGMLQSAGVIDSGRGVIRIRDRDQLERHACECYAIIRKETNAFSPRRMD